MPASRTVPQPMGRRRKLVGRRSISVNLGYTAYLILQWVSSINLQNTDKAKQLAISMLNVPANGWKAPLRESHSRLAHICFNLLKSY